MIGKVQGHPLFGFMNSGLRQIQPTYYNPSTTPTFSSGPLMRLQQFPIELCSLNLRWPHDECVDLEGQPRSPNGSSSGIKVQRNVLSPYERLGQEYLNMASSFDQATSAPGPHVEIMTPPVLRMTLGDVISGWKLLHKDTKVTSLRAIRNVKSDSRVDPGEIFHAVANPPMSGDYISTTELMDTDMLLNMTPVGQYFNNQSTSLSTNGQRTERVHLCGQCGKAFARRALAEGCENRDSGADIVYHLQAQRHSPARKSGTDTIAFLHRNKYLVGSGQS
ncbi:1281_t:CDS:2 [Acaulospora colombiana]|uniref:1281_t:CDS:1 n=1 Tax=Acaulospora colombiana TaxID=27376 RepID=A0ACA9LQZ9_9GLOM|nr:1281_t:CDS:2 [Acaulospora colombiana]